MNRPALISVFSDQRRTKSTTRSRTSCGTHTLVRAPQGFFLRPCAQPSIRPAPHPSSGSSFPGTRSVVVRLGGPDGSWTGRQPPRSRRTLFANGRTRSEEHTSELQSQSNLVCRLLLEKKKKTQYMTPYE